jgi:hypothetical protein
MTAKCDHGCSALVAPVAGDPLEPDSPYCPVCGHIKGRECGDVCDFSNDAQGGNVDIWLLALSYSALIAYGTYLYFIV